MTSVPKGRGPLPRELTAWELQTTFLRALRKKKRYTNIVTGGSAGDLLPLWRAFVAAHEEDRLVLFDDLMRRAEDNRWQVEDGYAEADPTLTDYVDAVRSFVGETLRSTWQGEGAFWLLQAVHGDVLGVPLTPAIAVFASKSEASLRFSVTPLEASWALVDATGLAEPEIVAADDVQAPDWGKHDWDHLRRVAYAQVDEMIGLLEQHHNAKLSGERPHRDKLDNWHSKAIPALVDWLWEGKRLPYSDDMRRDLLAALQLDAPRKRRPN